METHHATRPRQAGPAAPGDVARGDHLDALDESLLAVRRLFQRPGYRRRLLETSSWDLEHATLRLLRTVERADPAATVGAVADHLSIDPSTASRSVDRAVTAGLLDRRACADDRRRSRLHLTDAGREALREVTERRRQLLAEVTAAWEVAELDRLTELLARLEAGFAQLDEPT